MTTTTTTVTMTTRHRHTQTESDRVEYAIVATITEIDGLTLTRLVQVDVGVSLPLVDSDERRIDVTYIEPAGNQSVSWVLTDDDEVQQWRWSDGSTLIVPDDLLTVVERRVRVQAVDSHGRAVMAYRAALDVGMTRGTP